MFSLLILAKPDKKIDTPEVHKCESRCNFIPCENVAVKQVKLGLCLCGQRGTRWLCQECINKLPKFGE